MSTLIRHTAYSIALFSLVTSLATSSARAAVVGPYTVDANTMHLFHFDETANPIMDDPAVANDYSLGSGAFDFNNNTQQGQPGTLGHSAFSPAFGTAGRTNRACCGNSTGIGSEERGWTQFGLASAATLYGSNSTAFTLEVLLKFNQVGDSDFFEILRTQSSNMRVIYNASGGNNFLNFTVPDGAGTYISAPLTIDTSKWYHAAFVYDGVGTTTNNVRIYFTEMDDANTEANLVSTFSTGILGGNYTDSPLWIGGPSGGQVNALFDEVRVSNIARSSTDMMFSGAVPEPSSFALAGLGLLGLVGWSLRRHKAV